MAQNLYSLGLLRNGKVYQNKTVAYAALTGETTNDGVAKLARYLYTEGNNTVIRTLVGFYANADEMVNNGGGQSYYTVIDIEGSAAEVEEIKQEIDAINNIIGDGIDDKTLTEAINNINEKIGEGFDENFTVADALEQLEEELTNALTITVEASDNPDYAKVYTIKQGGNAVGTINIPKDIVIKEGKLVYGEWDGDEFHENTEQHHYGDEPAIKLVLNNDEVIYINAKDLVDVYTGGNGIQLVNNVISIKLDETSEPFLTVGPNGIKLDGVQAAIDAVSLESGNGISISSKKINAVAAENSAPGINNPITVDEDGIKFASTLDCGFFDNNG